MMNLFSFGDDSLGSEVSQRLKSLEEKLLGHLVVEGDTQTRRILPIGVWVPAIPGDRKSPEIMKILDDVLIIKFPPYSSDKYDHKMISRNKIATITKGTLYNKKTGKCWGEGESFEVNPEDDIIPVTRTEGCLATVKLI
jgi:hypothetical protein